MFSNQDFAKGINDYKEGKTKEEMWAQLSEHLSNFGPHKSINQWKTVCIYI